MIKEIWVPSLIDIMPQNILADKQLNAAAEALDLELKALSYDAPQVLHIPRLDELNHDVLDNLAWQFHVDHYEPTTMSLEVKRNLIRQSILWHRIKGTPQSVENFLGAFGIKAEVEEWYKYGGEPYFFKLKVSDVAYLGDDGETFLRLVYAAKNERSWLDRFIFDLTREPPDIEIFVGTAEVYANREFIDNATPSRVDSKLYLSAVTQDRIIEEVQGDTSTLVRNDNQLEIVNILCDRISEEILTYKPTDDDFDEEFEKLLWEKWLKWKHNPLVKIYDHHFDDDEGEIDPDDPNEPFPFGRDFLRLYWEFPYTKRVRYMTLKNPRKDISGADINSVADYAVANKVLVDSRGFKTLGVKRAFIVTKTIENIFGGTSDAGYIHPPKDDNGKFPPRPHKGK